MSNEQELLIFLAAMYFGLPFVLGLFLLTLPRKKSTSDEKKF